MSSDLAAAEAQHAETAVAVSQATKTTSAQAAYAAGDSEASKAVHDSMRVSAAPERHGGVGSDYIKSVVFGGLDGVITTFSTIASIAGGDLPITTILVMGFSNLIADGISMGVGDFLSSQAEFDFLVSERTREMWEFENHPEGEVEEMVEVLKSRGLEEGDATTIITTMAQPQHKNFFVDFMMTEELGQEIPDDPLGPAKDGAVTFIAFLIFGSVPLWVYVFVYGAKYHDKNGTFGIACAATALTLAALGATQGWMTRQGLGKSALLMMINGSLASAAAYLVSWGIMRAIGNGSEGCE